MTVRLSDFGARVFSIERKSSLLPVLDLLDPDNQTGLKFARKAREVLRPGGVAVFWEAIPPDGEPTPLGLALETSFDLGMSPRAPLETEMSFEALCGDIGYSDVDYVSCLGGATSFALAHR